VSGVTGAFDFLLEVPTSTLDRTTAFLHGHPTPLVEQPHRMGPFLLDDSASARSTIPAAERTGVYAYTRAQLGPPEFSVGTGDALRMAIPIRARCESAGGSAHLPEALNGTLTVGAPIRVSAAAGGDLITADFASSAVTVAFVPRAPSTLTSAQRALVERAARNFIRGNLTSAGVLVRHVDLGGGRRPGPFRIGLSSANRSVRAAGTLDGRDVPASSLGSLPPLARGGDDGVAALSGDSLERELRAAIAPASRFRVSGGVMNWDVRIDPPRLALGTGFAEIRIDGVADSDWAFGIGDFSFHVTQRFGLSFEGTAPRLTALGDPDVSLDGAAGFFFFLFRGAVTAELRRQRDSYLATANDTLRAAVPSALLTDALRTVGLGPDAVSVAAVEVTPAGVVLRLRLRLPDATARPVASFVEQTAGAGVRLDAFASWIPGGTVHEFHWVGSASDTVDFTATDFVALAPSRDADGMPYRWCLDVRGERARALGGGQQSTRLCRVSVPQFTFIPIPWLATIVIYDPGDPARNARAIGQLDVRFPQGGPVALPTAVLISDAKLAGVGAFRAALLDKGRRYQAVVALPGDALTSLTGKQLHALGGLAVGNDADGAWSRVADRTKPGAAILSAAGKVVWSSKDAELDGLAAALEEHSDAQDASPVSAPVAGVSIGSAAPEFAVRTHDGAVTGSGLLAGKRSRVVVTAEWAHSSGDLIEELRGQEAVPTILAVSDTENGHGSALAKRAPRDWLLADLPSEELALRLGVRCYPSVVELDEQGRVLAVHEGASAAPKGYGAEAASQ
jgi:hypothetical protein